jgi:hypothetical protein
MPMDRAIDQGDRRSLGFARAIGPEVRMATQPTGIEVEMRHNPMAFLLFFTRPTVEIDGPLHSVRSVCAAG